MVRLAPYIEIATQEKVNKGTWTRAQTGIASGGMGTTMEIGAPRWGRLNVTGGICECPPHLFCGQQWAAGMADPVQCLFSAY